MLTFIEICAGIGGMRVAMEKFGYKCMGFCECEEWNTKIYKDLHDTQGLWFAKDVERVRPQDVPNVDCYCITCPDYVTKDAVPLLAIRKPKLVIVEGNIGGTTYLKEILEELGYYVELEGSNRKYKWGYAIGQKHTNHKILPIGIDDLIEQEVTFEGKGFPKELLEILKRVPSIDETNILLRLTHIPVICEILKKLESLGGKL